MLYVDCRGIIYEDLSDSRIIDRLTFLITGLRERDIIDTLITKYKENNIPIDLHLIREIARKCIINLEVEIDTSSKPINEDFFISKKVIKTVIVSDSKDDTPQLSLF